MGGPKDVEDWVDLQEPPFYNNGGGYVENRRKNKGKTVTQDSSVADEEESESSEGRLEDFDMPEETTYYFGPFDRICSYFSGNSGILKELVGSDLEDECFDEKVYIFVLIVSSISLYRP